MVGRGDASEPAFLAPMEIRACGLGPLLDVGPAGLDSVTEEACHP